MVEETFCLVVYDVADDRIRQRFADACLDAGLERFQMSAFSGRLAASRRKELYLKLVELLGDAPGRILVQPACAEDVKHQGVLHQVERKDTAVESPKTRKGRREYPEPGREKPTVIKL